MPTAARIIEGHQHPAVLGDVTLMTQTEAADNYRCSKLVRSPNASSLSRPFVHGEGWEGMFWIITLVPFS